LFLVLFFNAKSAAALAYAWEFDAVIHGVETCNLDAILHGVSHPGPKMKFCRPEVHM
jgi:hypothetical protein